MAFVPDGTVVVTGGRFVKVFFVDNTCQVFLSNQLGSSVMAARFGKLSTHTKKKHHKKIKKLSNICKYAKIL